MEAEEKTGNMEDIGKFMVLEGGAAKLLGVGGWEEAENELEEACTEARGGVGVGEMEESMNGSDDKG